jgi:hypothetical protein
MFLCSYHSREKLKHREDEFHKRVKQLEQKEKYLFEVEARLKQMEIDVNMKIAQFEEQKRLLEESNSEKGDDIKENTIIDTTMYLGTPQHKLGTPNSKSGSRRESISTPLSKMVISPSTLVKRGRVFQVKQMG